MLNHLCFAFRQLLKNHGPNEPKSIGKARKFLAGRTTPDSNPEQIDPKASAAQVRAARGLGDKPVVILSHSLSFRLDPSLPEEVSLKLEKVAGQLQADLKGISSNSTLRQSASGGHYLHVEDPELVIQGIRHALDTAKKRPNQPMKSDRSSTNSQPAKRSELLYETETGISLHERP